MTKPIDDKKIKEVFGTSLIGIKRDKNRIPTIEVDLNKYAKMIGIKSKTSKSKVSSSDEVINVDSLLQELEDEESGKKIK